MTTRTRLALVALAIIVAIVAFVLASSSSTSTKSAQGTAVQIRVQAGKVVGGVQSIIANKGGRVRFSVTSDRADEIHVHGYDLKRDIPAGETVRFDFPAKIDGLFVVELEHENQPIGALKVEP